MEVVVVVVVVVVFADLTEAFSGGRSNSSGSIRFRRGTDPIEVLVVAVVVAPSRP